MFVKLVLLKSPFLLLPLKVLELCASHSLLMCCPSRLKKKALLQMLEEHWGGEYMVAKLTLKKSEVEEESGN